MTLWVSPLSWLTTPNGRSLRGMSGTSARLACPPPHPGCCLDAERDAGISSRGVSYVNLHLEITVDVIVVLVIVNNGNIIKSVITIVVGNIITFE